MQVIAGVAIPSAAILISTVLALQIAKSERIAGAEAREDERAQVAADRLEQRSDDAFVRALIGLATLNTINLRAESAAEPFRELRVGLTLLDAASDSPDSDALADWFESERLAGLEQARESMRRLSLVPSILQSEADVEAVVAAGAPLNTWARDFANNLRRWRRDGATRSELVMLADKARSLGPPSQVTTEAPPGN